MWIYDALSHCKRWVTEATIQRWHKWAIGHPHAHAVVHNTLVGVPVCLRTGAIIVAGVLPPAGIIPQYYGPPFNGLGGVPFLGEGAYPPTFGYTPSGDYLPGGYAGGFGDIPSFGGLPGLFGLGGGGFAGIPNSGNLLAANLPTNQNALVNQPNTSILPTTNVNMPSMDMSPVNISQISPGNMQPGDMPPNNEQTPPTNTTSTPPVNTPEGASWMFLATPLIFCLRRRT